MPAARAAGRRATVPAPSLTVERFTLANGLRVVVNPDRAAATTAVVVNYDVGFRSEPEGRTGFAHLFEHLAFQGSYSLDKGEADKLIEGNGGFNNGSTHPDYTNYLAMVPANALELALFLEADRMRGLRLTPDNLQNQIDVVKEEIRVNVLNRPYGGFPWIDLPPIMFRTFHNAHNGYGSFVDLEGATVEAAAEFFDRYYAPANATLCVAGDTSTEEAQQLVERHFGDIAARPAPEPPDCSEPLPDGERRGTKTDPLAPMPALAVGYRVPDPIAELDDYLAVAVLGDVLAEGEAARLHRRLVKEDRLATMVGAMLGAFGDPLDARDPTMLQVLAYHPGGPADAVLAAVDDELARLVDGGVPADELDRVRTGMLSAYLRRLDHVLHRALLLCTLEQQRGRGELINELVTRLGGVDGAAVVAASERWLVPSRRAVLELVPGGER